jgi:hypothetical protein
VQQSNTFKYIFAKAKKTKEFLTSLCGKPAAENIGIF